jgi:SSS family solute:Na+ symporter
MIHNQLHTVDLVIIGAYLIAMVMVGLVVVRKVKNMDDYYLGGRSFGPLVLMATVCATIIGGSGLMGRAGVAYSSGFKAIMTALPSWDVRVFRLCRTHLRCGYDLCRYLHSRSF